MNFKALSAQLDDVDDRCAETVAAGIANSVSEWAVANGFPSLVREWTPAAQPIEVRKYIAMAIAATAEKPSGPPATALTPPEVAKQLGVSPETVISWIRTRFLVASNLATGARPRYVVKPSDLEDFLASRQVP